ncbi:hypothetical protein [Listeria booriae]|uniref:hypothetical protein n=1 Tax=Listeria booriae TaxID=1552123 RepID=UPI0016287D84|nr:hypothetical protein [Listeria booriae]MBC1309309.1 hypothetical protein [Listeria booriae]
MNISLLSGAIIASVFVCLYALLKLEQHQANLVKKYRLVKLIISFYVLYKTTQLFCFITLQDENNGWLTFCIGLLLTLVNLLIYKQVTSFIGSKTLRVLATIGLNPREDKRFKQAFLVLCAFAFIGLGLWKGLVLADAWEYRVSIGNIYTLLFTFFLVCFFYVFVFWLAVSARVSLIRYWGMFLFLILLVLSIPGWLSFFQVHTMFYFILLILVQEYVLYQYVIRSVRKQINEYGYVPDSDFFLQSSAKMRRFFRIGG